MSFLFGLQSQAGCPFTVAEMSPDSGLTCYQLSFLMVPETSPCCHPHGRSLGDLFMHEHPSLWLARLHLPLARWGPPKTMGARRAIYYEEKEQLPTPFFLIICFQKCPHQSLVTEPLSPAWFWKALTPSQVLMTRSQAQSLHPNPSPRFLGNMLVCGLGPGICSFMV